MRPADIGNWGLLQVVQEGGRLLRHHFGIFLPAITVGVFPASFINVLYAQIRHMDFVSPPGVDTQGSTEETAWRFQYAYRILDPLVRPVTNIFILLGAVLMFGELTNVVYSDGTVDTTTMHTETLLDSMKLALVMKDVETENPVLQTTTMESSLYHRIRRTSKGKKLKALAAIFVLLMLSTTCKVVGEGFSPEAVTAMGLLPWMAFLVTLPLTVVVTLWTSYFILVYLVMFIWLCSPSFELCNLETNYCERGERVVLTGSASSYSCDEEEEVQPLGEGQATPKDYTIPKQHFVKNKWRHLLK